MSKNSIQPQEILKLKKFSTLSEQQAKEIIECITTFCEIIYSISAKNFTHESDKGANLNPSKELVYLPKAA